MGDVRFACGRSAVTLLLGLICVATAETALAGATTFRLGGRVTEFPLCQGIMRGVTVHLEPLGLNDVTDLNLGEFDFGEVPVGTYTLSVSPRCNPFGCWPDVTVEVSQGDLGVTLCPDANTPTRTSTPTVGTPDPTPTPTRTAEPTGTIRPIQISCELSIVPTSPVVGDSVAVTVVRTSTGLGYPSYTLAANSLFTGETGERSTSSFTLEAVTAGVTTLRGSTMDEFIVGYSNGLPYYSFYPASCNAEVEVLPAGSTPTPEPSVPTPTVSPTPSNCASGVLPNFQNTCCFSCESSNSCVPTSGDTGCFTVVAPENCQWAAVARELVDISITEGEVGSGTDMVCYSVAANFSTNGRVFHIDVGGQTYRVGQDRVPTPVPTTPTATFTPTPEVTPGEDVCLADCDGLDGVAIDEVMLAVSIALETSNLTLCEAADGSGNGFVTIEEVVGAVEALFDGCISTVTP